MTEVKLFECEICGKRFNSKIDAEICEKEHLRPISVYTDRKYTQSWNHALDSEDRTVPNRVIVGFDNGKKYRYEFVPHYNW